jgi:hypothetical protein
MSTEVTTDEPVLELDGKKYVISDLSDQAKYFVQALSQIQGKLNQIKIDHDTMVVAQEGFTARLKEEVEKDPEEVSEES